MFVDKVSFWDRLPFPMIHKEHLIIYDRQDKTGFLKLLEYYSSHQEEARKIAQAGKEFVLAHHMGVNRVDYMLQSLRET